MPLGKKDIASVNSLEIPFRLVIADDHELIREGIKRIGRPGADLKIVGEAGDLKQALALIAQVRPDVAVLDITLPDTDGLDGLMMLRRHFPAGYHEGKNPADVRAAPAAT